MERYDVKNRIIWILCVTVLWYVIIFSFFEELVGGRLLDITVKLIMGDSPNYSAVKFCMLYLSTIFGFIGLLVYTGVTKRNRFVLKTFLPGYGGNRAGAIFKGLLVGFLMNFGCIACALINGDIKLYLTFAAAQIPIFIFALVCVFIQSTAEELWCRGFVYERINVRYPLWVAIAVNGIFFGLLHCMNPGVSFLPIFDIIICGLSFSIAKWYTNSIWFPMGIHTGWNFTQNFLFGLPNSGIVSEASIFTLDAASARDSVVYNVAFGVEGAVPAVFADLILGVVCLILAARKGRLGELNRKLCDQPVWEPQKKVEQERYVYVDESDKTTS